MTKMIKKEDYKEFIFENVIVGPYYLTYLIGIPVFILIFFLYTEYGIEYLGVFGLITVFIIALSIIFYIQKKKSSTLKIRISSEYLMINDRKYDKDEIKGLYSYDYTHDRKSIISIQFVLKNGKKIEITDTEYRNNYDETKGNTLKIFLKKIITEFNFKKYKKKKIKVFAKSRCLLV